MPNLFECHNSASAGHPRIRKTYAHVRQHFIWFGLHRDLHDNVLQCRKYQVNNAIRLKAGGLLQPLEIPNGKWESILVDFIVGLPTINCGHDSIWGIIDCLAKMCWFVPTKTTVKTLELARLFVEIVYWLYGLLANIVSDCN